MDEIRDIIYLGNIAAQVHLNDEEMANAERLSQIRNAKPATFTDIREDGTLIDEKDHYHGLRGETAVAKLLGVELADPTHTDVGKRGHPNIYYKGKGIAVCNVQYTPPYLKFDKLERFNGDWAILCQNAKGTYKPALHWVVVVGAIPRDRFIKEHYIDNFGHGPCLCMKPWNLIPIRDWIELLSG